MRVSRPFAGHEDRFTEIPEGELVEKMREAANEMVFSPPLPDVAPPRPPVIRAAPPVLTSPPAPPTRDAAPPAPEPVESQEQPLPGLGGEGGVRELREDVVDVGAEPLGRASRGEGGLDPAAEPLVVLAGGGDGLQEDMAQVARLVWTQLPGELLQERRPSC
mgnify:CR=1 FL=1